MVEDLVMAAVNQAFGRARELAQQGGDGPGHRGPSHASGTDGELTGMAYAGPIARLVRELAKLPGIGEKTAARLSFHILRASAEDAAALAAAIVDIKQKIRFCSLCCDLTEQDTCAICADARRDSSIVCVVAQPQDVVAIERAGGYRGRYHVLHGIPSCRWTGSVRRICGWPS